MSELREGQIWKARARGSRPERYVMIWHNPGASVYVAAITADPSPANGDLWRPRKGARITSILYSRFNGSDFTLHKDVVV